MTNPMPEKVKRNFVYRKLWNDVYRKNKNAMLLFLGPPGSGKSWAALKICESLDKTFNADRVVFDVEGFLKLLNEGDRYGKLKRGSAVLFDEIAGSEKGADSRSALSKENKLMSYVITTFRLRGLITCYSSPLFSQVDSNVRRVGLVGLFYMQSIDYGRKKSKAAFHWVFPAKFVSKTYVPKPRLKDKSTGEIFEVVAVNIPKPTDVLIKAYEEKKLNFLNTALLRWQEQLKEKNAQQATEKVSMQHFFNQAWPRINDFINAKGKMETALLRCEFDLTRDNAAALAKALQLKYDKSQG